jgi:tungstate transport system substrate-binding protein
MRSSLAALVIPIILASGCSASAERIVVAAGTTLVDSGFLQGVLDEYEGAGQVSLVGVSSREAFSLGEAGSAEVLITHLAEAEDAYLVEHPEARQAPIFTSSFAVVGPADAPVDAADALTLLRSIAETGAPFVSRADGSGTAAREAELWALAGIDPTGRPWYTETGQGMGFTLQVADQRKAFTLTEVGSFLAAKSITLVPFVDGTEDELLANPYRITLVAGAGSEAGELYSWLTSAEGRKAIDAANLELFGESVYEPAS